MSINALEIDLELRLLVLLWDLLSLDLFGLFLAFLTHCVISKFFITNIRAMSISNNIYN